MMTSTAILASDQDDYTRIQWRTLDVLSNQIPGPKSKKRRSRKWNEKKKKKKKKKRSASPSKQNSNSVNNIDDSSGLVIENPGTINLRVKQKKNREPRSRDILEAILEASPDNAEANFELGLICFKENLFDSAIEMLKKADRLLGERADHRLLSTLGQAYLCKYKEGEDGVEQYFLESAHRSLTRALKHKENSQNRNFRLALAQVYEAYGEIQEAWEEYANALQDHPEHEKNGFLSLKIADMCFHPDFAGEHHELGIQYLEYSAVNNPPEEFDEAQLTFLCARAYQIVGREDEGTNWMYYVFETFRWPVLKEKNDDYKDLSIEEAFITWGSDYKQWLIRARLYAKHDMRVFAVDAYSQALQLATEHTYEMWIEIGQACYKIRRVEPALQAVASALELDRVNPIGRNLLRRWSDEWVEMLDAEERYVVIIQAKLRSIWGRRKGKKYMRQAREKKKKRKRAVITIQIWGRYQIGRHRRKKQRLIEQERKRKIRFMLTRITHRVIAMTFTPWKTWYIQNKGVRNMLKKRIGQIEGKCFGAWVRWVDERLEEKRRLKAIEDEQNKKIIKSLTKILNRVKHQSFESWRVFTARSLHVKNKMRNAILKRKMDLFKRWYINVWDAIEEIQIENEVTVVIRSTQADGKRRRLQQNLIRKAATSPTSQNPEDRNDDYVASTPSPSKRQQPLSPYVVGSGKSWKRDHKRGTAIMSALYRARSSGCAMLPGGHPITEAELVKLSSFKSLISQVAPLTRADCRYSIAPILKVNTVLRTLLLYNGDIRDKGVMAIAEALSQSRISVLQTLGLGQNGIGVRGAKALAACLEQKHVSLTALYLENNDKVGDEGLMAISSALETNVRLEKLIMSKASITDRGVLQLSKALRENDTLNTLHLNDNEITSKGARSIASVIGVDNVILRKLKLAGNSEIRDEGGMALVKAICRIDGVIQELDLSKCNIGDPTADTLVRSLAKEAVTVDVLKLDTILFSGNDIGGQSGKKLAMMLNHKCPYCTVDLADNSIDAETEAFIAFMHFQKRIGSPRRSPRAKMPPPRTKSPAWTDQQPKPFSPNGFIFSAVQQKKIGNGIISGNENEIEEKRAATV
eukprot:g6981.t1